MEDHPCSWAILHRNSFPHGLCSASVDPFQSQKPNKKSKLFLRKFGFVWSFFNVSALIGFGFVWSFFNVSALIGTRIHSPIEYQSRAFQPISIPPFPPFSSAKPSLRIEYWPLLNESQSKFKSQLREEIENFWRDILKIVPPDLPQKLSSRDGGPPMFMGNPPSQQLSPCSCSTPAAPWSADPSTPRSGRANAWPGRAAIEGRVRSPAPTGPLAERRAIAARVRT